MWGRQDKLMDSRVPWGSDCAQCTAAPPCLGLITMVLGGTGPMSCMCPSGLAKKPGPLKSGCPEATESCFRDCAERQPFQFDFNPPSFSHFHFHCFSFCTGLAADNTYLSLPPASCLSARLCHLLEAVTPIMISLHEGTCVCLWAALARV